VREINDRNKLSAESGPVLILAHSYPPVSHSGSQRPHRFAKYLSRQGRRVEVMTSTQFLDAPSSPGVDRSPAAPRTAFGRAVRTAVWKLAAPLRAYDYGFTWVFHSGSRSRKLVRELGPCLVLSTFPPLSTHLTALRLKRRFGGKDGVRWIADFRDPMIGNPFRGTHAVARMLDRHLETAIIREADAVIVNTDVLAGELQQRYPEWAKKISVLWNGYDPEEEFGPLPIPPRDYRVLAHVGTIYGGRHPALLIDSMDRLRTHGCPCIDRIRLLQIGSADTTDMPNRERFEELAREGRIELSGERVARADALRAIAEADLLLVLDLNLSGHSTQVPAKIFDYVRAGRPILLFTSRGSPADGIVRNCGIPHRIVYHDDSPALVDAAVSEFLNLPSVPTRPSDWFRQRFDGERQARELDELIRRL
jgi:glycosyltransferase involved in cell wall biosynthesis